jgi:hypothetical protein
MNLTPSCYKPLRSSILLSSHQHLGLPKGLFPSDCPTIIFFGGVAGLILFYFTSRYDLLSMRHSVSFTGQWKHTFVFVYLHYNCIFFGKLWENCTIEKGKSGWSFTFMYLIHLLTYKLINFFGIRENCLISGRGLLWYQFTRKAVKLPVVILIIKYPYYL